MLNYSSIISSIRGGVVDGFLIRDGSSDVFSQRHEATKERKLTDQELCAVVPSLKIDFGEVCRDESETVLSTRAPYLGICIPDQSN